MSGDLPTSSVTDLQYLYFMFGKVNLIQILNTPNKFATLAIKMEETQTPLIQPKQSVNGHSY